MAETLIKKAFAATHTHEADLKAKFEQQLSALEPNLTQRWSRTAAIPIKCACWRRLPGKGRGRQLSCRTARARKTAEAAGGGREAAGGRRQGVALRQTASILAHALAHIPAELKAELGRLKAAIVQEEADDDPDELTSAMEEYLLDLVNDIQEDIDDAINDGDMGVFVGLRESVADDPLLEHLLTAPKVDRAHLQSGSSTFGAVGRCSSSGSSATLSRALRTRPCPRR